MTSRWNSGNPARRLENGEEFFPAVFDAIRSARTEVIIETFILFEDKVGLELQSVLLEAAGRSVQVDVLVDGFGASDLTADYLRKLTAAGVRLRSFDPSSRIFGIRVNVLRRMHRKIVVVDPQRAFVGGINYSAELRGTTNLASQTSPRANGGQTPRARSPYCSSCWSSCWSSRWSSRRWPGTRARGSGPKSAPPWASTGWH